MKKRPGVKELQRRAGQSHLDRLTTAVPPGFAGLLERTHLARMAARPHPGEEHVWSEWGDWRPAFVKPVLAVRWFHVARRCERCGESDRRWLEREPRFDAEVEDLDGEYLTTVPLARYLELARITLPDPLATFGS